MDDGRILEGDEMSKTLGSIWHLRAAAIAWLRYERQCPLICFERSPMPHGYFYIPDVIGVTKGRHAIEIEIKRTVADFKAQAKKPGLEWGSQHFRQSYFIVPPELVEKVKPILPQGNGLMTVSEKMLYGCHQACVVVGASINKSAPRLGMREIVAMAKDQSASLQRCATAIAKLESEKFCPVEAA